MDRGKSGTALNLACDARSMPLSAVIRGANANDGRQVEHLLKGLVVHPPQPQGPPPPPCSWNQQDSRAWPTAQGDGAYGYHPTRKRAHRARFRLRAPQRGQRLPGLGRVRSAVERCHNFFGQFGRVARRLDRSARRYLGWVQLAACIIFIRAGFVP